MVDNKFFGDGENVEADIICCTDGACVACVTAEEEEYLPGLHAVGDTESEVEHFREAIENNAPELASASTALITALADDPEAYKILKDELCL